MIVLLSPWSRKADCAGRWNPKDYPHWRAVVSGLAMLGIKTRQVSCAWEPDVAGCIDRVEGLSFAAIGQLIKDCTTWLAVDNFWPHLAWAVGKRGVAVFGPSDPSIFGHPENVNLLLGRQHLRPDQFGVWGAVQWRPEIFPPPAAVIAAVQSLV